VVAATILVMVVAGTNHMIHLLALILLLLLLLLLLAHLILEAAKVIGLASHAIPVPVTFTTRGRGPLI